MQQILIAYAAAAALFLAVDYVWLKRVAGPMYRGAVGDLLRAKPKIGAAALFYVVYVAGIVYIAVWPSLPNDAPGALLSGCVLGALAYGTYDITNHATLRNWPLKIALIDTAWGTGLTGVAALAGHLAARLAGAD